MKRKYVGLAYTADQTGQVSFKELVSDITHRKSMLSPIMSPQIIHRNHTNNARGCFSPEMSGAMELILPGPRSLAW
jgi:hypothetical protein